VLKARNPTVSLFPIEFGSGTDFGLEGIPVGPLKISIDAIYEDVDFQLLRTYL
jgi:hypothetical protein